MMGVVTAAGQGRIAAICVFGLILALGAGADAARSKGKGKGKRKPRPGRQTVKQVAVLELGALGMSSAMRKNLEMLVQNSITTMSGFKVIPPVDIQMALREPKNRAVAACGGGPDCAVQIGRLVSADIVVFGTISTIGEAFSLNLRVMDVKKGKEMAREKSRISGNRDLLIPEVRLATYKLVAPDKISGSLIIEIDLDDVEIEIDGHKVGTTPLEGPIEGLKPGPHVVVLKRKGFSEFQKEFVIKPFETLKLKLEPGKAED